MTYWEAGRRRGGGLKEPSVVIPAKAGIQGGLGRAGGGDHVPPAWPKRNDSGFPIKDVGNDILGGLSPTVVIGGE